MSKPASIALGVLGTDPAKVALQLETFGRIIACGPGDRGPDLKTAREVWAKGTGPTLAVVCRNEDEVKQLRRLLRGMKR